MKTMKTLFCAIILIGGFSISAIAQVTATATSTATIVTPITITKTVDMDFGNVAVGATGGTVILSPASVRTETGGVTLPAVTGTVAAASFTVTGTAGYTYAITLPSTDLTITSGANTMAVNTFTSSPTPTGTLDGSGNETLTVGATLNVDANQPSGVYVSGTPFEVTVNYN